MLYVNTEVNGQAVKAFVDSGAQATISAFPSPSLNTPVHLIRFLTSYHSISVPRLC